MKRVVPRPRRRREQKAALPEAAISFRFEQFLVDEQRTEVRSIKIDEDGTAEGIGRGAEAPEAWI